MILSYDSLSNRSSFHDDQNDPKALNASAFSSHFGDDSYRNYPRYFVFGMSLGEEVAP